MDDQAKQLDQQWAHVLVLESERTRASTKAGKWELKMGEMMVHKLVYWMVLQKE